MSLMKALSLSWHVLKTIYKSKFNQNGKNQVIFIEILLGLVEYLLMKKLARFIFASYDCFFISI